MFLYDAFNRGEATNCQGFIKEMLISENLYSPEVDKFVFQDLTDIQKSTHSYVPTVARAVTDIGAVFGLGTHHNSDNYALHAIVVKKPVSMSELDKIHKEFVKDKKKMFVRETPKSYRIRNIPKTKFIKGTYKTKKVKGHNISLIFGELKNKGGAKPKDNIYYGSDELPKNKVRATLQQALEKNRVKLFGINKVDKNVLAKYDYEKMLKRKEARKKTATKKKKYNIDKEAIKLGVRIGKIKKYLFQKENGKFIKDRNGELILYDVADEHKKLYQEQLLRELEDLENKLEERRGGAKKQYYCGINSSKKPLGDMMQCMKQNDIGYYGNKEVDRNEYDDYLHDKKFMQAEKRREYARKYRLKKLAEKKK
jgi:hypothetical protein